MRRFSLLLVLASIARLSSQTVFAIDLNGDGMSDVWQDQYAAYGILPGDDMDGDGKTNLEESLLGTNPFGGEPHPPDTTPAVTATNVTFQTPTVSGILYQPEITEDLGNLWDELGDPVLGDGNILEDTVTMGVGDTQLFTVSAALSPGRMWTSTD